MKLPVAIITGSTGHIGRSIVEYLSCKGFSLICLGKGHYRDELNLPLRHNKVEFPGQRFQYMSLDLSSPLSSSCLLEDKRYPGFNYSKLKEETMEFFHYKTWNNSTYQYKLQLLINVVGINQRGQLSLKMSPEDLTSLMNINLINPMILTQYISRQMMRESLKDRDKDMKRPCIINITSQLGHLAKSDVPGTAIYSTTKAGLSHYTKALQSTEMNKEIWPRLFEISPGVVKNTGMINELPLGAQKKLSLLCKEEITTNEIATRVWELYNQDGQG